jgi:general secretion pathway protein K
MTRAHRQSGVVLVLTLWTIALLSALAMATSATFRGFAGLVSVSQDKVKADALLSAGVEEAASVLAHFGDHWPAASESFDIRLATGEAEVTLTDEAGRIDINRAPVEVLSSLLQYVGAENAEPLARAIATWRDHDSAAPPSSAGGAPPPSSSGSSQKPPSFTDMRQLLEVPGITPETMVAVEPLITVFGAEKVNALTAPQEVLAALPGVKSGDVAAILRARASTPVNDSQLQSALSSGGGALELRKGRSAASVEIRTTLIDGYREALRATIIVLAHDSAPYRVLAWTPERAGPVASEAASPVEP